MILDSIGQFKEGDSINIKSWNSNIIQIQEEKYI
jgi:hypothetical protein